MLGKGVSSKNIAVYNVSHNEVYACPRMGRDGGRSRKANFFKFCERTMELSNRIISVAFVFRTKHSITCFIV